MPLREYDCPKCGTFEVLQKHSDELLTKHDACGEPVTKKLSLSSFALKGGGWYSDGYASGGAKSASGGEGGCGAGACGAGGCGMAQA
jgi:putative FmdB family regulatory protein